MSLGLIADLFRIDCPANVPRMSRAAEGNQNNRTQAWISEHKHEHGLNGPKILTYFIGIYHISINLVTITYHWLSALFECPNVLTIDNNNG